jgi:uncharacterized protein (TIGR00255 family)
MTGFGRTEQTIGDKTYIIELKALNGKQFELQLKLPALLKPFEFDVRNLIQEKLQRGTIECNINLKQNGAVKPVVLNTDLIKNYYSQIKTLSEEIGVDTNMVLSSILRLPEVVAPATDVIAEKDFADFKNVLNDAMQQLYLHRQTEGKSLKADLVSRIENIKAQEVKIAAFLPDRTKKIKEDLQNLLAEHVGKENVDANRFEQEIIYYLEKIDIHEEQVRLGQHNKYFLEILEAAEESKGKKLSFVLQEIGREINTTGSKAYNADIQKCVVTMKDELEKAKEQVLNVL